ncbi:response regulator [candidate division KSB1 bacterium]|nr:response regulator [candidate division KSB1 bacterium]
MRILIAEDDNISRRLLEANLKKKEYEVVVVKDGTEAWEQMILPDPPPLAILDWMMPGFDGVELCRKIRSKKDAPYIYIMLLTAKASKEDIITGLEAGADDYITKPFHPVELHARVQTGERIINLQNNLHEHMQKLKNFDRQKTEFLSMVSHELRTPLAVMGEGISLFIDGILGEMTDTQKDVMQDLDDNIERLKRLISDLLDISKIESGKIILRKNSMDLCEVVNKLETGILKQAEQKGINTEIRMPEHPCPLFADEDKIIQIFNNLISNAIRYTPKDGQISILVEEEKFFYKCQVIDTGTGISKENLKKMFTRFAQFDRVEDDEYKGTGLGLVIVKGLIEKHGGAIYVDSILDKGTTLTFTVVKESFPSILIVEDEVSVLELIKEFLAEEKYPLFEATSGNKAIKLATENEPSLILLDIKLKDMSGYEVIGRLRQNIRTRDIPIIAMSAFDIDVDLMEEMNQNLSIPFVQKPFEKDLLLKKIRAQWIN